MKNDRFDIEELALHSDFKNLAYDEQETVLKEMNAEEFDRLRTFLKAAKSELKRDAQTAIPRAETHAFLKNRLQEKHALQPKVFVLNSFKNVVNFKIPAYQIAAVFALFMFWNMYSQKGLQPQIVYVKADEKAIAQRVADSIREELQNELRAEIQNVVLKETPVRTVVIREVVPKIGEEKTLIKEVLKTEKERVTEAPNMFVGLRNFENVDAQKRGKTLAEDTSAMKFVTTATAKF
jgi:hypothetical protein